MQLAMCGVNHHTADVAVRERFSLTEAAAREALGTIVRQPETAGCVLLPTCNRTELYLAFPSGSRPDLPALICGALGLEVEPYKNYFTCREGAEVVEYLCEVAAGIHSQVLGEDQILAQVKEAIGAARKAQTACPELETLFRTAVTAGKRVKTQVHFFKAGGSVAMQAVQRLAEGHPPESTAPVLVIGNGEIGQLVAGHLLERGYEVRMTLRRYSHGQPKLPAGCEPVEYENRYGAMAGCGVVISATTSPHFTVRRDEVEGLPRWPALFIDLAVPRDIEPTVAEIYGVTLWNVDDLGALGVQENEQSLAEARCIIQEEAARFALWQKGKNTALRPAFAKGTLSLAVQGGPVHKPAVADTPAAPPPGQAGPARFPAFIDLCGSRAVVVGGGKIAARRVGVLLRFEAAVRVVSPALCEELAELARQRAVEWEARPYREGDLDGAVLAVAATDDREVNRAVGRAAKAAGVLVSVADSQAECSFFFPAIVQSERLTAGIVSNHGDHALVRKTAAILRERLEQIETDDTGGQPAEPLGGGADTACDRTVGGALPLHRVAAGANDDQR